MTISDEQLKKDRQEFRHSPYSFHPTNKNWKTVLRLMHNIEKLPYDGTPRYLKECLNKEVQMDKLDFISEGLSMGSNKADLELACLVHKPIKELTDDDRLTGYLSRGIYRYEKDTHQKFSQMFIQKLEENGYDPQKISDIVFKNVDYDDNDNEIIKDISFPQNRHLAR